MGDGQPRDCPNQTHCRDERIGVCDAAHRLGVMKKETREGVVYSAMVRSNFSRATNHAKLRLRKHLRI